MKLKPSLAGALLPLLLWGCGSREEGIRLHLTLAHQASRSAQVEGTTRQFTTAQGEHIVLTRALVTLFSVEVFPCPEASGWRWLRQLSPVGTAHAHSASGPLRLGTPHVSSLERPDGEGLALGTLRPPPGRYCRVHLVFGPADADAVGLPTDGSMEGRTLLLEGVRLPSDGGAGQPFRLESAGIGHAELSLDGLSLSAEALESHQLIALAYDRWLDDVLLSDAGAASQVLHNLAQSATLSSP